MLILQKLKSKFVWMLIAIIIYVRIELARNYSMTLLRSILSPRLPPSIPDTVATLKVEPGEPAPPKARGLIFSSFSLKDGVNELELRKIQYPLLWTGGHEHSLQRKRRRLLKVLDNLCALRTLSEAPPTTTTPSPL